MENFVEDVVVETVTGSVEDTVKEQAEQGVVEAVTDAANDGSVAGMVIAGTMTVFAGIGAFCTGKFIKNKVKGFIDKRKAKKQAKLEAAQAPAQIPLVTPVHPVSEAPKSGEYLTAGEAVQATDDDEVTITKVTPKKEK